MRYHYEPFNGTDEQWAAYVALHNKAWPDFPTTESEARHEAARWNRDFVKERFLMTRDGLPLGHGTWCEPYWAPRAGKYHLDWFVDPDSGNGADAALGEFLVELVRPLSPETLESDAREDQTERLVWLAERGFTPVKQYNCSELSVAEFDEGPFAEKCARAVSNGLRVISVSEIRATYDDWLDRLYALNCALVVDLPAPDPVVPEPRESFAARFERPGHDGDAYFVAMDGDLPVGMSNLKRCLAEPERLDVGLTGVRREYRRRGLCTALKVRANLWARENGYARIVTDNEANNPMYAINAAMGFRPMPAFITFHAQGLA